MIRHLGIFRVFIAMVIMIAFPSMAQTSGPSHLERMTYEDLLELFNDFNGDSLAQERIARTYLERARRDGDTVKVARGYDRLARVFQPETNLKYADSLIEFTKDWNHVTYPAMGYILKAFELGRQNNIREKYNFLSLALDFARINDNVSQSTYILGELWNIRNKWGNIKKAHEMQNERHSILLSKDYFIKLKKCTRPEKHNDLVSIRNSHLMDSYKAYVISYLSFNQIDSAKIYLDSINHKLNLYDGGLKKQHYWWVKDAEIEISFYSGNYIDVISKSDSILNIKSFKEHSNNYLSTILFRGIAEYRLGNIEKSIVFLNEVEEGQRHFDYLHNDYLKLLFETKLEINRSLSNRDKQIYYLDQLLKIDSVEASLFKFIEPKLVNEIDTVQLIKKKELLIKELNNVHRIDTIRFAIILILLIIVGITAFHYYRLKIIFKKRFENLLENKGKVTAQKRAEGKLDLSPSVIEDILGRLEKFEKEKLFLDAEITLNSLAKSFQTNSSYLSRVLNHHKELNFSQYLNGLRVGYALERLKNHPTFRKYTIEAIAFECGYKNSASFSRAFYRITGIYPSYYINELNKIKE